jgi:hypothetical protein
MERTASMRLPTGIVSALMVPCSSRKRIRSDRVSCAVSLPISQQSDLETAWLERVSELPKSCKAKDLYGGRGFQLALRTSAVSCAPLYAVSAGLGLVSAETIVPSYGITVSGKGDESIGTRVFGQFDPASWWSAISLGPYSTSIASVFENSGSGLVVMALSQPYARMLAPALSSLPDVAIERLRILGSNLVQFLPQRLAATAMPYDDRLEAVVAGTRSDFAQRALLHFVSNGLVVVPNGDLKAHREWVTSALAGKRRPVRKQRVRLADEDILGLIKQNLSTTISIGRLLRILRDQEGVACEQARFSRLYRQAVDEGIAV